MTEAEWAALQRGDILQHEMHGDSYVVDSVGPQLILVRTLLASNPREWNVVARVKQTPPDAFPPVTPAPPSTVDAVMAATVARLTTEPIHIMTQNNQPYGSERRCCEKCGVMLGYTGSPAWTDSWSVYAVPPPQYVPCR